MTDDLERARACANRMYENDKASQALGIEIEIPETGSAVATMTVREDMANGFDLCHGGLIFTLADTAFAFACNAYDDVTVAVLYGDVPLVSVHSLQAMLDVAGHDAVGLMTAMLEDPAAYGRIIRDENQRFRQIVEFSDATEGQQAIREINTGFLAAPARRLREWLAKVDCDNAQGEFYLTDVFSMAVDEGVGVETCQPVHTDEILGVNNREDLAVLERIYQQRAARRLMQQGLSLRDPGRFDLRGNLMHGEDCSIDVNVVIEGNVRLGDRVTIGPNCCLKNMQIGNDVNIQANCVLEQARIGDEAVIGPYARLRPEADISTDKFKLCCRS